MEEHFVRLAAQLEALDQKLTDHILSEAKELAELKEMWQGAKALVSVIKVGAMVTAGVTAAWLWVVNHFTIHPK